jgi:hypothetical protein
MDTRSGCTLPSLRPKPNVTFVGLLTTNGHDRHAGFVLAPGLPFDRGPIDLKGVLRYARFIASGGWSSLCMPRQLVWKILFSWLGVLGEFCSSCF